LYCEVTAQSPDSFLHPVRLMGSTGLGSLLFARELVQTTRTQLHIAGLATRVIARSLQAADLLERVRYLSHLGRALGATGRLTLSPPPGS
jgi:hypothetical protein